MSSDIDNCLQNNSKIFNINTVIIYPDRRNIKEENIYNQKVDVNGNGDGQQHRTHACVAPSFQPLRPSKLSQISTTLFSNLLA